MLDKEFFTQLRERNAAYGSARRELIKRSDDARNASKRAIFALHRDDHETAESLLSDAKESLSLVGEMAKENRNLLHEGSYRAALEEFVEASLYRQFVEKGTVGPIEGVEDIGYDTYLGGLADLAGELQRRLVRFATERNIEEVKGIKGTIDAIIGEMMAMDLSGYLRNKFDQAKNSQRRAEDILYEVTLRS